MLVVQHRLARLRRQVAGALGPLGAVIFLTTLSFLFSTPGALSLKHPAGGFLMKDVVLLGACVATAAEALRAARARSAPRRDVSVPGIPASRAAS
jgi:uncharacterized membrane protein YkgB